MQIKKKYLHCLVLNSFFQISILLVAHIHTLMKIVRLV